MTEDPNELPLPFPPPATFVQEAVKTAEDIAESVVEKVEEIMGSKEAPEPPSDAHNMNWTDAQICLQRGQNVARNGWHLNATHISMDADGKRFRVFNGAHHVDYWQPTDADRGADDWRVLG